MRRLVVALLGMFAMSVTAAKAADMPVKAPVVQAPAIYNWTGFYLGATAGYAWGHSKHCDTPAFCTNGFDVDGFVGGGEAGYNWQWTNWVLGIEADFSGSDAKGSTVTVPGVFGCGAANVCDTRLDWFGTVRGRVGWAFNRFLPYVTGGYAYGQLHASLDNPAVTSNTDTKSGWAAGGGLEYALPWDHWSVKAEYLYVKLGDLFYDTQQVCGSLSCTAVENHYNVFRGGVNYRF